MCSRWSRPPFPQLDPAKNTLVFQQLELDHYIGTGTYNISTIIYAIRMDCEGNGLLPRDVPPKIT